MFNVGDCVFNQKTGHQGKVIGYGHQILKSGYTTTLKVLVVGSQTFRNRGFVEEDLYSVWVEWAGTAQHFQLLLKGENAHP